MERREYTHAHRLLERWSFDGHLGDQERLALRSLTTSESDGHPDAHALRLRLVLKLSLFESDAAQDFSWDVHTEYERYFCRFSIAFTCHSDDIRSHPDT
jgi:hypothetical protein